MVPAFRTHRRCSASSHNPKPECALIERLEGRMLLSGTGATVGGMVYNDLDASGRLKHGDAGLSGWQVFVDVNNDGRLDQSEPVAVTDAAGNWSISGLAAGIYTIREVPQANWRQTSPAAIVVRVGPHSKISHRNFGNTQAAVVSGSVFLDSNGNGVQDAGEPGVRGCKVFADLNGNGKLDRGEPFAVTDSHGNYTLRAVPPGTVTIREVPKHGFSITTPASGTFVLTLAALQVSTGNNFGIKKGGGTKTPPPNPGGGNPPPPTGDGFVITDTRSIWQVDPSKDIITFYALDPGTGPLAGSSRLIAEESTLASPGGLVIRTYDDEGSGKNDDADFGGRSTTPKASYISLGPSMIVASTTPVATDNSYHDFQLVNQFEVSGALIAGAPATTGRGAVIAVAVVPHGSAVTISGKLSADQGPTFLNFSASA